MKKINIIMIIMLFSGLAFAEQINRYDQQTGYPEWSEFLHEQMIRYTETEQIPNAVIAVVSKDNIHLLKGYGYADMNNQIEVDPEKHLFRVGSVSKIFTWTAIMQLYEAGFLDLDKDMYEYIDNRFDFKIKYDKNKKMPITIKHLLTHTAGFANTFRGIFSFSPQPPLRQYLEERMPPLIYPPGEVIAYSNYGTALAGYIVEQVSGMSFEEYCEVNILIPLGMNKSSFHQPLPSSLQEHLVNSYRLLDGEYVPGNFEYMPAPAGGMSTTALDMAQFMMGNLNRGVNSYGASLKPETIQTMHSTLFTYHPHISGMTYGFMEYNINGLKIIAHGGSSTIFDAGFYLFPEIDMGLFIAYSGGDYNGHPKILHTFLNEFFPVKEEAVIEDMTALYLTDFHSLKGEYLHTLRIVNGIDKILNLAFGNMQVKTVENNGLDVSVYGQNFSFEQVAPGIFKNNDPDYRYPYGPLQYLMTAQAPCGKMMLVTEGPASFIKVSLFNSSGFTLLIFLPALLLAVGSLLFYLIRFIIRIIRKNTISPHKRAKHNLIIIFHSLAFLIILFLLMGQAEPHPVHLMPEFFFGDSPVVHSLLGIMGLIASTFTLVLIVIVIKAWKEQSWKITAKIYYSIYTLWSIGLVWLFINYNLFWM